MKFKKSALFSHMAIFLAMIATISGIFLGSFSESVADESKPLRIAIDSEYAPYSLIGPTGEPTGLAVEIWRAWSEVTGTPVEFVASDWQATLDALKNGTVDIHMGLFANASRAAWADFAEPIHRIDTALFFRAGKGGITDLDELSGEMVGVWAGTYQHQYLIDEYPKVEPVIAKTGRDLILKLLNGDIRAVLNETPSVEADLASMGILGMVAHGDTLFSNYLRPAVRKGDVALLTRVKAGMADIPIEHLRNLEQMWLPKESNHYFAKIDNAKNQRKIELTATEKEWVSNNPKIRIANETDWPPFDYVREGKPYGFSIDMIQQAADQVGLSVEFVNGFVWSELVAKFAAGELDVLPAVYFTPERSETMVFTDGYAVNPPALTLHKDSKDLNGLEDFAGRRLAVLPDTSFEHLLKERYPDIARIPVESALAGMQAVSFGKVDGFIESLSVVTVLLEENLLSNLRVVGAEGLHKQGENKLRMAVKKEDEILRGIIQKGLDAIDHGARSRLFEKHFAANRRLFEINTKTIVEIPLSTAEKQWLRDHPVLRVAPDPDYPPIEFFDDKGRYQGLAADLIRLAVERLGVSLEVVKKDNWTAAIDALRNGEADFIAANSPDEEFSKEFLFTSTYYEFYDAIVTHDGVKGAVRLEDLGGKEVLVAEGWPEVNILKNQYPDIKIVEVESTLDGVTKVAFKEYDYLFAYFPTASYLIREQGLTGLRVAGVSGEPLGDAAMFRKESEILRDLMDKAIASITEEERQTIKNRWIPGLADSSEFSGEERIKLTEKEKDWLERNPSMTYSEVNWKPMSIIEGGRMIGVMGDYLDIVTKEVGIQFKFVQTESWPEVLKKFEDGDLDMVPGIGNSESERALGLVSEAYSEYPLVIVGKDSMSFVNGPEDLTGMTLAMPQYYTSSNYIKENFPDLTVIDTSSIEEALSMVSSGDADVFVGHKLVAIYNIEALYLKNLKIIGLTDFEFRHSILIQNNDPEFLSIVNKVIDRISVKKKQQIYHDWVTVNIEQSVDFVLLIKIGAGVVAFLLVMVYWNRKLGREIAERKRTEEKLQSAYEVITESINYAAYIQRSVLPSEEAFASKLDDYFILWQPRDVVGGDIYWSREWGDGFLIVLGDCTGHGVPGAFMTLISTGAMDRALIEVEQGNVSAFLQRVHQAVQLTLGQDQDGGESDDGMELGVCYIEKGNAVMKFAGARFDLFIVKDEKVTVIKPTKSGIGYRGIPHHQIFDTHEIDLVSGASYYLTSDGLTDQIGGPRKRMYGKKRLRSLLAEINQKPMSEQREDILQALLEYQGDEVRRDDVAVIGFNV